MNKEKFRIVYKNLIDKCKEANAKYWSSHNLQLVKAAIFQFTLCQENMLQVHRKEQKRRKLLSDYIEVIKNLEKVL